VLFSTKRRTWALGWADFDFVVIAALGWAGRWCVDFVHDRGESVDGDLGVDDA